MIKREFKLCFSALVPVLLVAGCQTTPSGASEEVVIDSAIKMAPHFECALFHNRNKNEDGIAKSLDDAANIGEADGLGPNQILSVYNNTKSLTQEQVLERAISIAEDRPGLLPRIGGGPPQPDEAEEGQAWDELYAEQCNA